MVRWEDPDDYTDGSAMRWTAKWTIFFVVLGVGAVILAIMLWSGAAPWLGKAEQRRNTEGSGVYRQASYERFYDDCAAIQSLEDRIKIQKKDKSLPKDQKAANILGLQSLRSQLIREYNANARKTETMRPYMAKGLPKKIDETGTTTCEK